MFKYIEQSAHNFNNEIINWEKREGENINEK